MALWKQEAISYLPVFIGNFQTDNNSAQQYPGIVLIGKFCFQSLLRPSIFADSAQEVESFPL